MAFLCGFYHWTVDYCLDLPVRTFFAMSREGGKIEARQFLELAEIGLQHKMKFEWCLDLQRRYLAIINPPQDEETKPPIEPGPAIESGSSNAFRAMKSIGRNMRRAMGYGG